MKTITKSTILILLSFGLAQAQINQKWIQLGTGLNKNQTSQPSMAFDRNGNLFLAYTDQSTPQNKATLKKFDGQTWTTISSQFTPGQAQFIKLQLDSADVPYVAFQEPHPVTKKITVMKYNGTGWDTIGARGFATADFNNPELSFSINRSNNMLVIAYRENTTGKASVKLFPPSSSAWMQNGNASMTEGDATKLTLSSQGDYLAFSNGFRGGKLSVIKPGAGGAWVYVGDTVLSVGVPDYINLNRYVNISSGAYGIAYKDLSDNKAYLKVANDNNNIWGNVNNSALSDGAANYVSLAQKRSGLFNGNLYCGYADVTSAGNATVKKSHASVANGHTLVGKQGFTDTLGIFASAFYTTLGIDNQDSLYLAAQSINEYVVFKYRSVDLNLTGVTKHTTIAAFSVFPNPSNNVVTISNSEELIQSIKLISLDGKIVYENTSLNEETFSFDVSMYHAGLYFIEVQHDGKISRTKFIKE